MKPTEVLAKAAEIMAERGQAKGSYQLANDSDRGPRGAVCAYGAMTLAATGKYADFSDLPFRYNGKAALDLVGQAAELLAEHVESEFMTEPFGMITMFNDNPNTTAEDMILAMKKAAHR